MAVKNELSLRVRAAYNADFSRACQILKLRKIQFSFSESKLPCKVSEVPITESLYHTKHRDFFGHPQFVPIIRSCQLQRCQLSRVNCTVHLVDKPWGLPNSSQGFSCRRLDLYYGAAYRGQSYEAFLSTLR